MSNAQLLPGRPGCRWVCNTHHQRSLVAALSLAHCFRRGGRVLPGTGDRLRYLESLAGGTWSGPRPVPASAPHRPCPSPAGSPCSGRGRTAGCGSPSTASGTAGRFHRPLPWGGWGVDRMRRGRAPGWLMCSGAGSTVPWAGGARWRCQWATSAVICSLRGSPAPPGRSLTVSAAVSEAPVDNQDRGRAARGMRRFRAVAAHIGCAMPLVTITWPRYPPEAARIPRPGLPYCRPVRMTCRSPVTQGLL